MSEDVNIEVLDGGLGNVPAGADENHAVIGICSAGTAGQVLSTRDVGDLVDSRGVGPAVHGAAVALKRTGKTVLFCGVDASTPGKVKRSDDAAVNITSSTNASPIVVTAASHGYVTGDVVTIAGHLVNTAAVGTWIVTKVTDNTFSLNGSTGNGVGGATGTVQFTGVNVGSSTGTSKPTLTGAPLDSWAFRWKWIREGERGTAGATFKYSKDGGITYSAEQPIGTSTSFEIEGTGITIAFSTGTWKAGDEYRWKTVEPLWGVSDVQDCIAALADQEAKFRLIHLIGACSASDAHTLAEDIEDLAVAHRYLGLQVHARDFDPDDDEDEDAWIDDVADDFSAFESERVSVAAGHYPTSSPIDGTSVRRPLSFAAVARMMDRPIQEHAGRVRTGPLKGVQIPTRSMVTKLSLEDLPYHDSRKKTGLKDARLMTARTRIGRPGIFIDKPKLMSASTSDYQLWPHRFVIDKACDLTYEVLVDVLNDDLQLDDVTGFILDKEAKAIESRLRSAFRDGLLATRAASAVTAVLSRTDAIITTKTLTAKIRVTPKGYVEGIDVTVGFTNPALEIG